MAFVNPAATVTVGAVDSHHLLGLYRGQGKAIDEGIVGVFVGSPRGSSGKVPSERIAHRRSV